MPGSGETIIGLGFAQSSSSGSQKTAPAKRYFDLSFPLTSSCLLYKTLKSLKCMDCKRKVNFNIWMDTFNEG